MKVNKNWTAENIPDQKGKIVIITGANSGLGFEAATILSKKGATVIMAVRNLEKGSKALNKIQNHNPETKLELMLLDLSDLGSVRSFVNDFCLRYSQLHILINNAGVLWPKKREVTKQGFELQFGVNYLGHFALTGLLLGLISNTHDSRVVTQSSLAHYYNADIHFKDLNWNQHYSKTKAYAQSKLANLLFTYELHRQFKKHAINAIAVASHPGFADTDLFRENGFVNFIGPILGQKVERSVLPLLRAATDEELKGAEFIGPSGMFGFSGHPGIVRSAKKTYDTELAKELWNVSEQLTGIHYNFNQDTNHNCI